MLNLLRRSLLCLGLYAMLTPAAAQLAGRGKLLRTPETPFSPQDPKRKSYVGWEKFNAFSLAPGERLWWDSFATGNDLPTMLSRGVTHQSVNKVPQDYIRALPAEKRAVMVYAGSMYGARYVDNWYNLYDGLADAFTEEEGLLRGKISGFLGGQREYLGATEGKTPVSLMYLDFENRALYEGNLYARNIIYNGRFAIRGAKGGYSDGQYLSEYRANYPGDTRSNAELLSMRVRNTVDNGLYCPGGPEGGISEGEFLRRYGEGWGTKLCQIVTQSKQYNLMDGAKVAYIDVSPGEGDVNLLAPYLPDMQWAYRWPWGTDCGGNVEAGRWLDFSDASFYPRINTWRDGRFVYYGTPEFEPAIQANIAEDRHFLFSFLNAFENSYKLKGKAEFISLWYPFHDGAQGPESTHFDYPLRDDMAEAMAIFGIYYGTTFIVWSPHSFVTSPSAVSTVQGAFRPTEFFLGGLRRMAWHNDLRTGNFERVIPEISVDGGKTWSRDNLYQSKYNNRPVVRAIVKGNEILVIGYNTTTGSNNDLEVMVRYNNWQDKFTLRGFNSPDRRVYVGRAVMQ